MGGGGGGGGGGGAEGERRVLACPTVRVHPVRPSLRLVECWMCRLQRTSHSRQSKAFVSFLISGK